MNKEKIYKGIQCRLRDILSAFAQGSDVSPSQLYRMEGFVEACCEFQVITHDEAMQIMLDEYKDIFKQEYPFPLTQEFKIPALMKRAPVYPSTKEPNK